MKKKGLIISTVVMVVVLIASLTTATYAWFTTTNRTTIKGFNLNVVASNALNIGLRKDYTETMNTATDSSQQFVSGTCTFSGATDGTIKSGNWAGDPGLGATLDHQIIFGDMDKAVGFTTETLDENLSTTKTHVFAADTDTVFVANKGTDGLSNVKAAVANGKPAVDEAAPVRGDYAYLWLGVSPNKVLAEGATLHVFVQATGGGTDLGIATAIHVAYNVNGKGWHDVDAFGDSVRYTAKKANTTVKMPVATDEWGVKGTTVQGMADVPIKLDATAIDALDQVQFLIYLAGDDNDCIDAAKGVGATIALYFETEDASASAAPTAAALSETGILTVTGVENSTIEYSIDGINWTPVGGTWNTTSFTAKVALPESVKDKTVQVRQIEKNKSASAEFTITAENNKWKK